MYKASTFYLQLLLKTSKVSVVRPLIILFSINKKSFYQTQDKIRDINSKCRKKTNRLTQVNIDKNYYYYFPTPKYSLLVYCLFINNTLYNFIQIQNKYRHRDRLNYVI